MSIGLCWDLSSVVAGNLLFKDPCCDLLPVGGFCCLLVSAVICSLSGDLLFVGLCCDISPAGLRNFLFMGCCTDHS